MFLFPNYAIHVTVAQRATPVTKDIRSPYVMPKAEHQDHFAPCSLFFKKEMELSLIGLQNAGKTSLVNVIASGAFHEDMIPTVGFNMRKVTRGAVTIKLWDLGGQVKPARAFFMPLFLCMKSAFFVGCGLSDSDASFQDSQTTDGRAFKKTASHLLLSCFPSSPHHEAQMLLIQQRIVCAAQSRLTGRSLACSQGFGACGSDTVGVYRPSCM